MDDGQTDGQWKNEQWMGGDKGASDLIGEVTQQAAVFLTMKRDVYKQTSF